MPRWAVLLIVGLVLMLLPTIEARLARVGQVGTVLVIVAIVLLLIPVLR